MINKYLALFRITILEQVIIFVYITTLLFIKNLLQKKILKSLIKI